VTHELFNANANVVEIKDLWKKFQIYQDKTNSLKERIIFWGRQRTEEFWALKNINLAVPKGKTIGLIGRNGSGKSTLLKIISRILYPTQGEVKVKGRLSTLLELGAGFHPDFTGRENIYLNASILGFTKKEIKEFFENYKNLEPGKWVELKGFRPKDEAEKLIEKSYINR